MPSFRTSLAALARTKTKSPRCSGRGAASVHLDRFDLPGREVQQRERLGPGPVQRPRVDDPRPPRAVLLRDVAVAVEEVIELPTLLQVAEELAVVAVRERHARAVQVE